MSLGSVGAGVGLGDNGGDHLLDLPRQVAAAEHRFVRIEEDLEEVLSRADQLNNVGHHAQAEVVADFVVQRLRPATSLGLLHDTDAGQGAPPRG